MVVKIIKIPKGMEACIYLHNQPYTRDDGSKHLGFYFSNPSICSTESQDGLKIVIKKRK